jgi:hypothetical protein
VGQLLRNSFVLALQQRLNFIFRNVTVEHSEPNLAYWWVCIASTPSRWHKLHFNYMGALRITPFRQGTFILVSGPINFTMPELWTPLPRPCKDRAPILTSKNTFLGDAAGAIGLRVLSTFSSLPSFICSNKYLLCPRPHMGAEPRIWVHWPRYPQEMCFRNVMGVSIKEGNPISGHKH